MESSSHSVAVMVPSTFGELVGLMFLTVLVAGFFNGGDGRKLFVNFSLHCLVVTSQLTGLIIFFIFFTFYFPFLFCTAEEKEPYEAKARQDKKRYKDEISGYKNAQPMNVDSGNESDSE